MSKLIEKIVKTRYSKIALNLFLIEKENISSLDDYKEISNKLAILLFEIDSCETTQELYEKFKEGILFPVGTMEHEEILSEDINLRVRSWLWEYSEIDFDETKYTIEDVCNNLDKFKFL